MTRQPSSVHQTTRKNILRQVQIQAGQPKTNTATLGILSVLDGFIVSDIDMDKLSHIWITLEAEYGTLTLNSLRGLSFGGSRGHGTGIDNPSMSFPETLDDINDAFVSAQIYVSPVIIAREQKK